MTFYVDPPTQLVLTGLVVVFSASLFLRAMVFVHRIKRGAQPTYPSAWSAIQRRAIEQFRQVIGLALLVLWGTFLFVATAIETRWPHYGIIFFVILLLLISNAWLLLLLPRNWGQFGAMSRSFSIVITLLVVWWTAVFAATGWLLAKASTSPSLRLHTISGVYAATATPHQRSIEMAH
jgi:hypothetical protein